MIQERNQLNIELTDDQAEGTYSNLAVITHSHAEFILDFINVMPGMPKAKVKSRIILTPQHA
jgi:ribonuclease BN (tRNA processing enzyme)